MTTQLAVATQNARLDAIEVDVGVSPTLKLRTGAPPANVAASDTGTVVATMALPSDWMAAASAGTKSKLGTWQDPAADASWTAGTGGNTALSGQGGGGGGGSVTAGVAGMAGGAGGAVGGGGAGGGVGEGAGAGGAGGVGGAGQVRVYTY